jgi:Lon protease-like protein
MIGECLEKKEPFGIVRAFEQSVADVGCTAEIASVLKQYDDGRMDIITNGRRRFELLEVNEERSFLRAEVLYFEDDAAAPAEAELQRAIELQSELMQLAGAGPLSPPEGVKLNAFHLASSLPLDLDFKQKLLESRIESERLAMLVVYYEAALPQLRRRLKVRQRAGGNGYVH